MDRVDTKTSLILQLLMRDAALAEYVFFNSQTDGFWRLPVEDAKTARGKEAWQAAMKNGFHMIAVIAVMKDPTPDGKPRIEEALMPGATEADVQRAKVLFIDGLIRKGILKPNAAEV
jgi:hypothetical protein